MKKLFIITIALALVILPVIAKKSGQLTCSGSTTVLPIAQAEAEAFMSKHPEVNISIRGGGSGVGVAALISGTTNIANSSRPMKAKEISQAKGKGINPVANIIANDGIAVIVSKTNNLKGLTLSQLKDIYSGKITNWSVLGGKHMPIVVISRDVASGTFEVFNEKVLAGTKVIDSAQMLASNNAIITTVADTPGAIGYVGLGYVNEKVNVLPVDKVVPSKETVKNASYKLSRKLYMYTNGKPAGEAARFIDFILSAEGQKIVEEQGFIDIH